MKINTFRAVLICCVMAAISAINPFISPAQARVVDNNPVTDQRWIISEIYLGTDDYKGAYIELYNNDDHTALGWKDFVINLPFDIDLPPIYDLHTYKPHAYKKLPLDEGWTGWLAKKYIQIMYGDQVFYEIQDALQEQDNYSYQRCQTTYDDGTVVLSNKFYYGKKTPGKPIECDDKTVTITNPDDMPEAGACTRLKLNEIGSYLEPEEQFIELVNSGNETINLSNCYVAKSKTDSAIHAQLEDYDLEPGGIYSFNVDGTDLESITKTSGIIYLIDSDDETVVNYKRYSGAKSNTSTALDENGQWKITYQLTPGEDNIIEEYPACPDGQYRDEDTHRCRNIPDNDEEDEELDENGLKPCKEGYERNPETNRCRKIVTDEEEELAPCKEGYERNPETNRCRKIVTDNDSDLVPCKEGYVRNPATNRCVKATSTEKELTPCKEGYVRNPATNRCIKATSAKKELTPCKEGYERNPETNRCVKKKDATANKEDAEAKYPVPDSSNSQNDIDSTTSLIIVIAIITMASIAILIWQYRREIGRWWHRLQNQTKQPKTSSAKSSDQPDNQTKDSSANQLAADDKVESSTDDWMDKLTS